MTAPDLAAPLIGSPTPRVGVSGGAGSVDSRVAQHVARLTGEPLLPWQVNVLDTLTERREDGSPRYTQAVVCLARQNGKTHLTMARIIGALISQPNITVLGMAQNLGLAREVFLKVLEAFEHPELRGLVGAPLGSSIVGPRLGNGQEELRLANGSRYLIRAATESASRGLSVDLLVVDEAALLSEGDWSAVSKVTSAKHGRAQQWLISNPPGRPPAGEVLRRIAAAGRAAASEGVADRLRLGYMEWSAPLDADPADPATWAMANPSLGYLISPETVAQELAVDSPDTFGRERLSQWLDADVSGAAIDPAHWAAALDPASTITGPTFLGVDIPLSRDRAVIAAAGRNAAGRVHVEVIHDRPGLSWVGPELKRLAKTHQAAVCLDPNGPAGTLATDLEMKRVRLLPLKSGELTRACASIADLASHGGLAHLGQPELDAALAAAQRRQVGDGAYAWTRRHSLGPIHALYAATFAAWAATTTRPSRPGIHLA